MSTWLVMLAPTAGAIAPNDAAYGLEPHRVLYQNPAEQGRLLASPAWRTFAEGDGKGWDARFDEATGTPRWMWGTGIPLPADRDAMLVALTALLDGHADLLGYEPGTLVVRSANHVAETDTWYVELDAPRAGLPTYRGGIAARIKHGNLVLLEVKTAPRATVAGSLALPARAAIERAIAAGPAPAAEHTERQASAVLLEQKSVQGHVLRTTWMVRSRTADPPGRWVSFVDAETGELLSVHNEVRYGSGTVSGKHHERTVDGSPLVTDPLPLIHVESDGDVTNADENGDYSVSGNGPYESLLKGDYATVKNDDGAEGSLSDSDPDLVWTSGDATQAEIDTYLFLHHVRDWGLVYAPEVSWVTDPVTAFVNLNDVCNAYWDGNVNFFQSGGGCNNTGQIADVVYHEWGHGFHYYSLEGGTFDGSLSEGAADTVSFLLTLDSEIGPFFGTSGWPVRDVGPNKKYPQDYTNNANYVHDNGLIFGGSMWDLLNLLIDSEGVTGGAASTSAIHAGLLKGGPEIPDSFYEALLADDDDGNLANGTPHVCELFEAFGNHGLSTASGGDIDAVLVTHAPVDAAEAEVPVPVEVDLVSVAAGCTAVGADSATIHYRTGKGSWETENMTPGGAAIDGEIPGQPDGTFVEYYLTGESDEGTPFSSPVGEKINPYSFYVGETLEVRCDDFDGDDGGYEVLEGPEWTHGVPAGLGGDPSGAYSGTKIWGIDLEGDGEYEKNTVYRLESPKVKTGHYTGVFLQYRRWLAVEDATYDQATISANGEVVWQNWESTPGDQTTLDGGWVNHAVDLGGIADQGDVRLEFGLVTDNGLQFGGWNVDDVCLLAPATPDNRLGITDFTVEVTGDTTVELGWTHPAHRPLKQVRVVRRVDRFPESADDGDIAEQIDDPQVGETVTFEDVNGHPGATYYAVYGFDGEDWLSWTVEGWNAATVDLVGGDVPAEDAFDTGGDGYLPMSGCACDAAGPTLAPAWLLLLGLGVGVRRRK
ncbi:MAG: hypothetical protein ABMA64_13190 [Myxococcota bacterium]